MEGAFNKTAVKVSQGVKLELGDGSVVVTGPKGTLTRDYPSGLKLEMGDGEVVVERKKEDKFSKSVQGTITAHIRNMIHGVTEGWSKALEIVGAGYRAEVRGTDLVLTIGYSHPIIIKAPEGITFKVEKSVVTIDGIDREVVGQVAADVRGARPPEPYRGKGIKYTDEVIRRKPGKAAAKAAV